MRTLVLIPVCMAACLGLTPGPVAAAAAPDSERVLLEQAWRACVRDAFTHQPTGQSKAGDQRNALDACKMREDAYVAAVMAAQAAEDEEARLGGRTITARARDWAASVAAYVVDPVSSWLAMLRR